jgi:hypothetical protein
MNEAIAAADHTPAPEGPKPDALVSEESASPDAIGKPQRISRTFDFPDDSPLLEVLREIAREQRESARLVSEVLSIVMSAASMRAHRERYWLILLTTQIILAVVMAVGIGFLVFTKDM